MSDSTKQDGLDGQAPSIRGLFDGKELAEAMKNLDALFLGLHLDSGHGNEQDGKDVGDFRFSGFFNYLF